LIFAILLLLAQSWGWWPWDNLAWCESRGQWHIATGNGFYGGLQIMESTWLANGGAAYASYPHYATREDQIAVAEVILANGGWSQWPACSRILGLR